MYCKKIKNKQLVIAIDINSVSIPSTLPLVLLANVFMNLINAQLQQQKTAAFCLPTQADSIVDNAKTWFCSETSSFIIYAILYMICTGLSMCHIHLIK